MILKDMKESETKTVGLFQNATRNMMVGVRAEIRKRNCPNKKQD
jgi:hypothetical protein